MNKTSIFSGDPDLQNLVRQLPQPDWISTNQVFHDLISCVVEQQIHYRSTKRIFAKALERAGIVELTLDNFHLFEQFGLSSINISEAKQQTLLAVIAYFKNHSTDFSQLSNEAVRHELSGIKGIGNWTIDMILMYTLKRPDIVPYDDFHLKQVMVGVYGLNPDSKLKVQMKAVADHWGSEKTLAVLYLLAWKQHKKQIA